MGWRDAMSVVRMTARVAVAMVLMTVGAMVVCRPGAVAVAMTACPLLPWCLGLSSGGASARRPLPRHLLCDAAGWSGLPAAVQQLHHRRGLPSSQVPRWVPHGHTLPSVASWHTQHWPPPSRNPVGRTLLGDPVLFKSWLSCELLSDLRAASHPLWAISVTVEIMGLWPWQP